MSGNTVGPAVTLAIGENGSKIAYFSHSAGTAHGEPPKAVLSEQKGRGAGGCLILKGQVRCGGRMSVAWLRDWCRADPQAVLKPSPGGSVMTDPSAPPVHTQAHNPPQLPRSPLNTAGGSGGGAMTLCTCIGACSCRSVVCIRCTQPPPGRQRVRLTGRRAIAGFHGWFQRRLPAVGTSGWDAMSGGCRPIEGPWRAVGRADGLPKEGGHSESAFLLFRQL